jgi:alpha-glucosidase/alpha-D-xyloside xylohydrolase
MGFHQCHWGYVNLSVVKEVVTQYEANNLPLDVMWGYILYIVFFNFYLFILVAGVLFFFFFWIKKILFFLF